MKVLHLIDSAGVYGAEQMLLNLAVELRKYGVASAIGSLRLPGEGERPIERVASRLDIPVWPLSARRGLDGTPFGRIARSSEDVDLIHAHGYKANILTAVFAGRMFHGPIVSTLHGWTGTSPLQRVWWYETFERRLLSRFDAVVAVNEAMSDFSKISSAVRRRLSVIANGMPLESPSTAVGGASSRATVQRVAQFCARAPTICAAGRLCREKGFEYLLAALAALDNEGVPAQLVIAGDGVLRDELAARAQRLGISDRVLFAGFVPDVSALFPLFRAFVLPSMREGLPIVLLEAMRAGIPSIASAVGGIPELLMHGECGLLVPPAEVGKLTDSIRSLITAPERARQLGDRGRQRFREKYTVSVMAARYLQLYQRVIEARCTSRVVA